MRNDTHLFYSGELTGTLNFNDNRFVLKLGSTRMVKIKCLVAPAQISFNGTSVDMDIKVGEEINLKLFQTSKVSVKGVGAKIRVWAY